MSGPPSWLWWATVIAVTVGVAAVGVAVVSAGLDWMDRWKGPRNGLSAPLAASEGSGDQIPASPGERRSEPRCRAATPTPQTNQPKPDRSTTMDKPRRHLRDAATICPAHMKLSNGLVISRCERDLGHDGKHKDGCTHWGDANSARPAVS